MLLVTSAPSRSQPFCDVRTCVSDGRLNDEGAAFSPRSVSLKKRRTSESLGIVRFGINPKNTGFDPEVLERINRNVLARVFREDRAYVSSTLLRGTFSLSLCMLNHTTAWEDVLQTLEVTERFGGTALAVSQELRGASSGYDLAGGPSCLVPSHVTLAPGQSRSFRGIVDDRNRCV